MSVSQKEFNKRLKEFSKSKLPLKVLIPGVQMKSKYEKILWMFYIEEKSYSEISRELNITVESVGNLLVEARNEFNSIIQTMGFLLPDDLQPYIQFLTKETD